MAEANKGAGAAAGAGPSAAAGAQTSAAAEKSAVKQPDPRMTRAAKYEEPGKTLAQAGYLPDGSMRVFNLLPGEMLPDGYVGLPPEGTHPNDPNRGLGASGGAPAAEPQKAG